MKVLPGGLSLNTFNTYRDVRAFQAPTKKPICPKYLRGACDGGSCPYFHPQNLPPQPTSPKTTPTPTKQPWKSTPNPTKPPTGQTPKTTTPVPPQQPKNDKEIVPAAVVPKRQGHKTPSTRSKPVELKTLRGPAASAQVPRQSTSSTPVSGSRTKSQTSNSDESAGNYTKSLKNIPNSVPTPQAVISCSLVTSTVTQDNVETAPVRGFPSSPSTSRTLLSMTQEGSGRGISPSLSSNMIASPRKNGDRGKKVESLTAERIHSPKRMPLEPGNIPKLSPANCDQKDIILSRREVCRNYLHKRCSQKPCPYYHDPCLAPFPPLCVRLYVGSCPWDTCPYFHPENNRNRMICKNALRGLCGFQNCYRFHFRLPSGEEVAPARREPLILPVRGGEIMQPSSLHTIRSSPPTPSTHGSNAGLHQVQCPAWNDGYCPQRRYCKMLHLPWAERWKMEAEQAAAMTMDRMIFDNTRVLFGAGCEIKEVTTALESCRVLISNLPSRTTREALENFLTSAGFYHFHILILRTSVDRETQEASVIFNDARHAEAVVGVLDKQEYFDEVLKFELAPVVMGGQMDDWTYNRSSYLEVTFHAPSKRVQAIYPSVEAAVEKAKVLNGGYCGGRIVHVTVARKPEEHETWTYIKNSIIITGVPVYTPDSEVERFAKPFSIRAFSVREFKVDTVLQKLEEHMQTVGGLKPGDFDFVQNNKKGTIFARGRFDTWEQADRAYRWLNETELNFLLPAHARFFLAFPHQYSLHVPLENYGAQKEVYDRLESQHRRDRAAHVVATRFRTVCLIQVVGIDKKAVGALKLKVEKIARGEVVEVWDRYFLNWQGETFFGRLLRQFGAYVRPDKTRQVLRVYGSEAAVNHARREIKEQMKTLAALDYQMNIEEYLVGFFIHKGMQILGDMLGEDNVWLHTTSKPYFVSVRGGHDADHALQRLVREARRRSLPPPRLDPSQTCPLCFEEPTQPFTLVCRHVYCTGCLKHTLISATDGESIPICCIGDAGWCRAPIPLPVVERFISPARLTQLLESSFRVYLEQRPNEFRFCPTPDCTQIYRASKEDSAVIQCPACLIETCSNCHTPPHPGLNCEENTLMGSKSGQEMLLERWAKGNSNVKKCPDCGIFIEKIDGCNHIHCRCGGHVCWICARTFNDGIYDHLSAAHGGAYDLFR